MNNSRTRLAYYVIYLTILSIITSCTTGKLYVSQPQVNTRERLVEQRLREVEWLKKELEKTDNITTSYQGMRDLREIVKVVGALKGKTNPDQGVLNKLELKNQILEKEIENQRLRELRYKTNKSYLDTVEGKKKDDDFTVSSTPVSSGTIGNITISNSTQPFNQNPTGVQSIDGSTILNKEVPADTSAKPGLLDLLHDKMAFRNAINSAIKETKLDDSHDLMGRMLYELNFSSTLVPGDWSSQYAQITLNLMPPDPDTRAPALKSLFSNWKNSLQTQIVSEIIGLQNKYRASRLDNAEVKFLRWFFSSYLPALDLSINSVEKKMDSLGNQYKNLLKQLDDTDDNSKILEVAKIFTKDLLESIKSNRLFYLLDKDFLEDGQTLRKTIEEDNKKSETDNSDSLKSLIPKVEKLLAVNSRIFSKYSEQQTSREKLKTFTTDALTFHPDDLLGPPDTRPEQPDYRKDIGDDKTQIVLKGIAWAVWSKYHHELARIVDISAPEIKFIPDPSDPDMVMVEGLEVNEVSALVERDKDGKESCDWAKKIGATFVDNKLGISNTGVVTFIDRLLKAEEHPYAMTVEPKEYAQNISDVSARKYMLDLLLSIDALIPGMGTNVKSDTRYIKDSQEILHAITRKPLLVGFGMGNNSFGWVVGPKFTIEDGKANFRHIPVRHDFSAGIVVPAWLDWIKVEGTYSWIDMFGTPHNKHALWENGKKHISVL